MTVTGRAAEGYQAFSAGPESLEGRSSHRYVTTAVATVISGLAEDKDPQILSDPRPKLEKEFTYARPTLIVTY